ncbi:MAG: IgGFc-binding protein [Deltaproteobacteria bacterium]|nr:IgGFc-binding protein [Deltaproteobacteria bacterium]
MIRSTFVASLCLAAALLVGCGKDTLTKKPVAPALCDAGHLNTLGMCVDCTANADCDVGKQCNLVTGTCEIIPPPPVDGGRVTTCQLGALRCSPDGHAVQDCVVADGGTDWNNQQVCTGSQVCNPQTLTCAICIPGETICDTSDTASTYQRCSNDGTEFDHLDCASTDGGFGGPGFFCHQINGHIDSTDGGSPTPALATCRLCQPGSVTTGTDPDGGSDVGLLTCDSTGTSQSFQSCYPTNRFADAGAGVPPTQCERPVCYPGQDQCADSSGHVNNPNTSPSRQTCNSDGSGWVQADCTSGEVCGPSSGDAAHCNSPCDIADNGTSYVGCDYWGVLMSNSGLDPAFTGGVTNQGIGSNPSQFALVVGNTSSNLTAHVSVTTNGISVAPVSVAPNSTGIVYLPWQEICGTGTGNLGYHLTSDVPVTVYQFNPLASAITTTRPNSSNTSCSSDSQCQASCCTFGCSDIAQNATCTHACVSGSCTAYSYSNDASLLLPTHLLGTSYVVVAEDEESIDEGTGQLPIPGAMAVVATQDNTTVQIHFAGSALSTTQSSQTSECTSVQGNLGSVGLGNTVQYTINSGQVLHFWNGATGQPVAQGANGIGGPGVATAYLYKDDFTGSVVSSDKAVAVFGGADCTFKPYNDFACDHIEEEMFPFSTWGKTYVGVKSKTYTGATATYPDYWRIVSACGPSSCPQGTTVTVSPPMGPSRAGAACGSACTCSTNGQTTTCQLPPLVQGQTAPWIEFQHGSSFTATGDHPIVLAQYFVSESAADSNQSNPTVAVGDPSLVLAPPVEQWRSDYSVLAPTTYAQNYVSLMVYDPNHSGGSPATGAIQVDGTTVPAGEWNNVPSTNYYTAVHALSNSGNGGHTINAANGVKVGAVVYGYDSYVSYGYTGGLDLQAITTITPGN